MGSKNKILLLLFLSSAMLVIAAVHLVQPLLETIKTQLARTASAALGMDVRFGQARLVFAPGLELSVKGLTARKDGVEALNLKELRVRLDLAKLLRRKVSVTRVTLIEPAAYVVRHKDGSFNFGGPGARSGKAVAISKLVVHGGRLVYVDESTGRRTEAAGLELNLDNFSYGGRRADGPLKKLFFIGEVDCAAVKTGNFSAAGLSLWVNAGRGLFTADPVSLTLGGVAGSGSLTADMAAEPPAYKLVYASGQFKVEDVLPGLYGGVSVWRNLRGTGVLRAGLAAAGNGADGLISSLSGTITVDGKELRLPAPGGGKDLLKAETIRVTADASDLARGEARLRLVSLTRPSVFLIRGAGAEPKRHGAASAAAAAGKPFIIDELDAAGGDFKYVGEKDAGIVMAANVTLALKKFSYGGRVGGGPAVKMAFDGKVKCSTLSFAGAVSTGVAAGVTASKGVFDIRQLALSSFRGQGSGSFRADLSVSPPSYKLVYTLSQFRLGEFLSSFSGGKAGPQNIKGRADLTVNVAARGKSADELRHTLAGRVALRGKRMTLPGIDVDEVIKKYVRSQNFNLLDVGAFLLAGPLGPAVTKSYNFADAGLSRGSNGVIQELSSVWNVKNGTAVAEDAAMATGKYRMAMKGGLDLADGHFDSVTTAVLDKKGCAAYSQKIHGTFAHPQIGKVTMLTSLAGPVLGVLETVGKLIPFQQCEVFYAGSVPQPK